MPASSSIKKVRISLIGSDGKMGKMVIALATDDPEVEICNDGDVVIDFSSPGGTRKAIALGKPLVCGTTGLSDAIFDEMQKLAKRAPVLYASNFSIGIHLLSEMLLASREKLKRFGKISIEEIHHAKKRDNPSGTALKLAYLLGVDEIETKRQGDVAGIHQVKIALDGEALSFRHEAHSREIFAKGALTCAKFLLNLPPKMYQLSEIFD